MSRKPLAAVLGLFTLTIVVGIAFASASSASPGQARTATQHKPSGLTSWGIANARQSGVPNSLVRMAPQSNLTLLAQAENLGPRAKSATMKLTISLKLRNVQQLKQFLSEVQNPDSPQYHHFMTPHQFTQLYGPTQAQVNAVKKFLQQNNIHVQDVSPNRTLIHTVGTTGDFERAFAIRINNYNLNGRTFLSTQDRPQLPRALSDVLLNVLGLDNSQLMRPHSHFKKLGGRSNGANPQVSPPAATSSSAYFNPSQIATAYDWPDITNPQNGASVSLAIITADTSGLASNDSPSTFWGAYGLPGHTINVIPVDGDEGLTDGLVETLLDMEWSGAMAPGITQNVYVAANPYFTTFTDAYNQFVNDDTSQVMTTSWGAPEFYWGQLAQTTDQIFIQGAAEGISMFAAAGDNGAADIPNNDGTGNNADFPSSSPYITAANGSVLTIAGISGAYGSETAWSPDYTGAPAGGGAISQLFLQPTWQTGAGVPDNGMRMNSDMALNSGSPDGSDYLVYDSRQGFGAVYGTSAVAPALAGLFAVGVSQQPNGVSLGQSNKLIYDDVNVGNYASDFHDITSGCNGELPDGSPSCAAVNWDHPTGWGTPKATSFLSHLGVSAPAGTLSGSITDADGNPVAGAAISVDGRYEAPSGNDGGYSIILPAGDHTVTVGAFGYALGTASVSVTASDTTTQNFTLEAAPTATVSGKVSDGSGHNYALYAEITVQIASTPSGYGKPKDIQVADVWSDPESGAYSVNLPEGYGYTIHVAAGFDGYNTASKTVTLSGDASQDFPLTVTDTCSAPGYQFNLGGFGQDFDGPVFPPAGWTVTSLPNNPAVMWELNSTAGWPNQTGGTGMAAMADSYVYTPNGIPAFDTSLVTPPISATSLQGTPILRYKAWFEGGDTLPLDVDITTNGGSTWTNILRWTGFQYEGPPNTPGVSASVDLGPYLPSSGDFQLRWHLYGPLETDYSSATAQIDDVVIGTCSPVPGGLVMGQVSDANTGEGLLGAHVADENGTGSETVENYADPNLPIGFYLFFDAAGQHTLSANAPSNYSTATAGITLNNDGVVTKNFSLKAAKVGVDPGQLTLHVAVNGSATASFALSNTGSAPAQYRILGIAAPAPATQQSPAVGGGVPLIRVPVPNRAWIKASLPWVVAQAAMSNASRPHSAGASPADDLGPQSAGSAWQAFAPYPKKVADNTAARDPATGKVYSMGGTYLDPYSGSVAGIDNSAFVYDPVSDAWSPIANAPVARQAAASAFVDGKYYVVNGWASGAEANPVAEMDIYDPATGQWNAGAPNPAPAGGGSAYAVLNGSLYIVGGCNDGPCSTSTNAVQVYHPYSDSWTSAANYPHPVTFASCGAIEGKLYCAGGIRNGAAEADGYVYDPLSNSWSPIADMFPPLGSSIYTAANGLLLVAGGVDGGANVVNEGEAYDPQTNSWVPLPNLPTTISRGGYACGLYQVGGITGYSDFFGAITTSVSRVLPGYTQQCGMVPYASWLTVAPASGTLDSGSSAKVTLTVDGTGQTAFTTSEAYLSIANKSPYGPVIVPLTVIWDPQPVHLVITGTANVDPIQKGNTLIYTLTVENRQMDGHGDATQTAMTYQLPAGVSYVSSGGDASCTVTQGTVSCDFGTVTPGASKTETVAVTVADAGTLTSHFEVSAREPDDSDSSTLDVNTTVTGTADVSASASDVTIPSSANGTIQMEVTNAGPDTATDVMFNISSGAAAKLLSATSSAGSCSLVSGQNALSCDIGDVPSGQSVNITVSAYGAYAGTATVTGQATTSADDPDQGNEVTTATVTVTGGSGGGGSGGGGGLGWLALAALLGLALAGTGRRRA